ncbi:hypothetical protein ACMA5I_02380 [Paracoccaceae bacterium GXU_MW_L88]
MSKQRLYRLIVSLGRKPGDGLPENATGGALLCYASGVDDAEAVRETVALLKQADMSVLEVEADDLPDDLPPEERELADRALAENAVIVAQQTAFYEGEND